MKRWHFAWILLLIHPFAGISQLPLIKGDSLVILESQIRKINRNVHFTLAPGPVSGATEKLGFFILPMLVYHLDRNDPVSPPSSTALLIYFDFYGSWQVAAKQSFYWNHNKWRAFFTVGLGELRLRYYGIGRDTTIIGSGSGEYSWVQQAAGNVSASCYRKIFKGFYGGLEYNYSYSRPRAEDSLGTQRLAQGGIVSGEQVTESILVPVFVWDNRDNIYWTTKGYYSSLSLQFSNQILLSSADYSIITGWVNGYHPLLKNSARLTLAWHFFLQSGWGDLPYTRLAAYGNGDHVTGYRRGKYMDESEVTAQAELRYDLWKFITLSGYAGTGKTFPSYTVFGQSAWLHFGGVRLYINILPSYNIRLKLDMAVARQDYGFYVGIGQGF